MQQTTPDAAEAAYAIRMVKCSLMAHITTDMTQRGLSQVQVSELLNIDPFQLSRISSGRHELFSLDYLVRLCRQLGYGVDLQFYRIDRSEH